MTERLGNYQFELLGATVAATLAAHLGHLPIWMWMPLALLLALRVWSRRRGAASVGPWIRLPLAALLLAVVVIHFGNVFGREPGSMLACGMLALKLLETERVRDAQVALAFAAFVLMSALLFTQTLWFALAIFAVLLLLLAALAALQPAPIGTRQPLRRDLRTAAWLLGASLPLAAAAFALVPRLGSPLWGSPGSNAVARTGLSDQMTPGALTDLLTDDSPAFRVSFDSAAPPAPALRYFRAIVLWDFDGATWSRQHSRDYAPLEPARPEGASTDYTITLEPTDRNWLPTLDLPLAAPTSAYLGADRVLRAYRPVTQPREYRMESATRYVLAPTLSPIERRRALALPIGFDPQARALAQRWHEQGLDDDAVVLAALRMFRASFIYTLNPPALGHDSIDDFLFTTRRGFCEHYSSAFVFLMRAGGIPARIVTGYQGGWWNRDGGYLLVRQSDAHAWAEVWIAGQGWRRVDPTAAVSPARVELGAAAANGNPGWAQADWLRALRNQFDFANRVWTQGIIRFDALRQKRMLTPFGIADANQGDLLLALSAVLGVMMIIAALWAMRRVVQRSDDGVERAWSRLLDRLARAGVARRRNEGPLDLLRRTRGHALTLGAQLAPLVEDYVDLHYANRAVTPERIDAFVRATRSFHSPKASKPSPEPATTA